MPPSDLREDMDRMIAEKAIKRPGFRMTKQRKAVYDVLLGKLDHPTATDVYARARDLMPGISLATVYNCLETLSDVGLVKQVNVDREASRYCPNQMDHAHFFCTSCGQVQDVDPTSRGSAVTAWNIPEGTRILQMEVAMKGVCAKCADSTVNEPS